MSLPTHQIQEAHEEFWRWIFSVDDGPNHPLKISNDGEAQKRIGNILILAGSFPDPDKIRKNRLLHIDSETKPDIEYIFVPAENCVYTEADMDGQTDQVLVNKANEDMLDSKASVLVENVPQKINRLPGHAFSPPLNIVKCIAGAGKSGKGEGESCTKNMAPSVTKAAAACDYAIIPASSLKSGHTIRIQGIGRAGPNQEPGYIDVTYKVQ